MKKILFVLSVLTLLSCGCNRNEDKGMQNNKGEMQREENLPIDQSGDAQMEQDQSGQRPGFEKEQNMENDVVTDPMDDQPDFQEDGPDINEEMER